VCGIFGIVGRRSEGDLACMREMGDRLAHRGPDGEGFYACPLGLMGMRRLAIIDAGAGAQPASNEDGAIRLTLNGEIYNFKELRERLARAGHAFTSAGDTETIAHAYEEYGTDLVHRLRGMFAFALFDRRRERAFFARDRFGKKPLYYAERDGRLVYASEIKAIFADPAVPRELDREALSHYFTFKHIPSPRTAFQGVRQLEPGTFAVYEDGKLSVHRYWRPSFAGDARIGEEEAQVRLIALLRDAVGARMEASDVPMGVFLSGGVDSSLIAALAAERGGAPLKTFSLGYVPRVAHKNDVDFAREIAARFGTEHHEVTISASTIADECVSALSALDEPFGGAISSFWLARAVGARVKVALCGDGADELFGSYAAHRRAALLPPNSAQGLLGAWRARFYAFTDEEKRALLTDDARGTEDSAGLLQTFFAQASSEDRVNAVLEVDCRTLLPDQVLVYADRLSMAHSLEVRSPFLDRAVSEFAGSLPGTYKVVPGQTKRLLRSVARHFLPAAVVDRPKEGFVLPLDAWLSKELVPLMREAFSPSWMRHGFFHTAPVERLMKEHAERIRDHTYKIWTLFAFQVWHRLVLPRVIR